MLAVRRPTPRNVRDGAGYWQGNYDAVADNPEAKLMAANAAYRKHAQSRRLVASRRRACMDTLVQAIRRDSCARIPATPKLRSTTNTSFASASDRRPQASGAPIDGRDAGLSIHGFEGGRRRIDMKNFKMTSRCVLNERLEAEKAGKGATKVKKGVGSC